MSKILEVNHKDFYNFNDEKNSTSYKQNTVKLFYNNTNKKYLLLTDNSAIYFDKIIGYYNNKNISDKENTPTLLLENNSKLIYFKLDDIFRNCSELFDKLNNLVVSNLTHEDNIQIFVESYCEEGNFKKGFYTLNYYPDDNKFLLKSTYGFLLFDKIIGFHNNDNQQNNYEYPTIICEYNFNLFYYKLDDMFIWSDDLWKKFNEMIINDYKNEKL